MLAGETFTLMDHPTRGIYRRSICALCRRDAFAAGWTASPTIPPRPDITPPPDPTG
jgi:hypothetical protein